MRTILLFISFPLLWPSIAAAFCSSPSFFGSEPSVPTYGKPNIPYCITGRSGCDQYELDSFKSEFENYVEQLRRYSNEAQEFANRAIEFSNEVTRYANCEIEDINSEIR